jgi:hypothetical protein
LGKGILAVLNPNDLLFALERGNFDSILGTIEGEQIEFKEAPYQLEVPSQRWEMAKDVAALANARGGVIVLGFRTSKQENRLADTASSQRPIQKSLISWSSYRDIISRWVHPGIVGLQANWFPSDPNADRGVFVLNIPAQLEESKHFIVCETTRDDGSFPGAIGIPVRNNDATNWVRPEALQSLVREALWWRRNGPSVAGSSANNLSLADEQIMVSERCRAIERLVGWDTTPFVALHALPEQPLTRPNNFYSNDGLRRRIEEPAVLRSDGFHISTYAHVEVQPDGSLASHSQRKALWLSPNGFLSAAGAAIGDFLGWYINQGRGAGQPLALNPRVTAEFILEFSRFFHRELKSYYTGNWNLWLSIVGFNRAGGVVLVPHLGQALGPHAFLMWDEFNQLHPIQPNADRRLRSVETSGADAYSLLIELYSLFGSPPDLIPYVENSEISENLIVPRR